MRLLRRLAILAGVLVVTAVVAVVAAERSDREPESVPSFSSVAELVAASDLVVVGEVTRVAPGRVTPAPAGSEVRGTQHLDVTVRVDETLAGASPAGDVITVSWTAWEIGADGARLDSLAGDQPEAGDRDLWFLFRWQPGVWGLVAAEGRLAVAGNVVSSRLDAGGAASMLDGATLDEVRRMLAQ